MSGVRTELITDYMEENKLSKNAFCKLCGVSVGTLNKILSNDCGRVRITAIIKINRLLKKGNELLIPLS